MERTYSKSSEIGFKFVFRTPWQHLTKLAKLQSPIHTGQVRTLTAEADVGKIQFFVVFGILIWNVVFEPTRTLLGLYFGPS